MRTLLVATVSALALLAGQALAQSATPPTSPSPSEPSAQQAPPSGDAATEAQPGAPSMQPGGTAGSAEQPGAAGADQSAAAGQDASQMQASDLIGKKIKLEGKEEAVGEITEVVEADGKPQQVVIDMGTMREEPVAVDVTELTQSGEDFVLSMTEQELAEAPAYEPGQQPGATRALPGQEQPAGQEQPGASGDQPAGQQPIPTPGAEGSPPQQSR